MSKLKYDFYSDGGHGWLKVPLSELEKLQIHTEISACSYIRKDNVYLEEDCDATLFINAKEKIGEKVEEKSHSQSDKSSKIRNYETYDYFDLISKTEWQKIQDRLDNSDNDQMKEILDEYNYNVELESRQLFQKGDLN